MPAAHPCLQMDPTAEAACASLLSEPLWPRQALPTPCRDELASAGQPEVMTAQQPRHSTCDSRAQSLGTQGGALQGSLEDIGMEDFIIAGKILPGPCGSSLG